MNTVMSRREALKAGALAAGTLAVPGALAGPCPARGMARLRPRSDGGSPGPAGNRVLDSRGL